MYEMQCKILVEKSLLNSEGYEKSEWIKNIQPNIR